MIRKKVIVHDRGLYLYLAQKLGQDFEKVWFFRPESSPYPPSGLGEIGADLPEIEVIHNFWEYVDRADMIVFPDCYDGKLASWLQGKGYRVFSSLLSEIVELDKVFHLEYLDRAGLPVPPTFRAEGIQDLCKYLEKCEPDQFLKTSFYRGDFETYHFRGMQHFDPWLNDLLQRIGKHRAASIEILVQSPIEAECEVGYDGFCVNGQYPDNSMCGYEIKDQGFVGKVFKKTPEIIANVNNAFAPLFKHLGYQGHYSTELRITKAGDPFYIDATCRAPSPPAEVMTEMYANYSESIWEISGGNLPDLKPKAKYAAEIILSSPWHENHELCVEFPKDLEKHIKLKNHKRTGDHYTCLPNQNAGTFGAVVAIGDSVKEVTGKVMDIVKEIKADDLEIHEETFDKAEEQVKSGEKYGIHFD